MDIALTLKLQGNREAFESIVSRAAEANRMIVVWDTSRASAVFLSTFAMGKQRFGSLSLRPLSRGRTNMILTQSRKEEEAGEEEMRRFLQVLFVELERNGFLT